MSDSSIAALLLTDIEQSTAHWQREPTRMPKVLDELDATIEQAVTPHGGRVVMSRGEGDGHFVVFPQASTAARAAAEVQRALARAPGNMLGVRVRAALHAGEVDARDDDYMGIAINRAARLRAVAHGGQIVASRTIVDLAYDALRGDLRFESLGRHRVRDFAGWTEVFQLGGPGLSTHFPPLQTLDIGLPPIATIVFFDAVNASAVLDDAPGNEHALMVKLEAAFGSAFRAARGEYIKHLGDGCFALFADPSAALDFAHRARGAASHIGVQMRCVIHVGRVEFARDEPVGRAIYTAGRMLRGVSAEQIVCTSTAAPFFTEEMLRDLCVQMTDSSKAG